MGITVVTGHRLEDLFEALLKQIENALPGPMQTETILVPGLGIARWLELRIAERIGIAAGIDMPFLGGYLHRLTNKNRTEVDPFSRDVLVLRLWRLLSEGGRRPDSKWAFGAATDYCKDDEDGRKRLQLCTRLAACLDDYQLYRDDLLTAFAQGDNQTSLSPHAPWQARIWRALLQDAGLQLPRTRSKNSGKDSSSESTPFLFSEMADNSSKQRSNTDQAHRLVALRANLEDPAWRSRELPPRMSVFGTTTIPPAFLDVLHRIAQHVDVHLYVPHPTPHYFGDMRERKKRSGDNALLARFGTESREFADQLIDLEEQGGDGATFEHIQCDSRDMGEEASTLLGCLQQDIVAAHDRGQAGDALFQLVPTDASVQVHDCHSPQRELEVVRDQIFAALRKDATLEAHDILVMVPNIELYAPYAQAVFGPMQQQLPFYIADRHPAHAQPICRALLSVLGLGSSRLTLIDVLSLLETPAVQHRFGLRSRDLPVLRHLCQRAGIRWGMDAQSRTENFHLPAFEENAWRSGLDRLLLGTLTGPVEDLVLGQLPVGDTTEARVEIISRFITFAETLFDQIVILRARHSFEDWADHIDAIQDDLFLAKGGEEEESLKTIQDTTRALRNQARAAKHTEPVALAAMRDWMQAELAHGAPSGGSMGGAITIAPMLPMRTVPARCMFVCGLNDESFPRRDKAAPFDLLAAKKRPGDRNRRLDDRQLFLDLILAARDQLHLSFVGRSAADNSEMAPSVVISELLEHINRTCQSPDDRKPQQHIVVKHPLQAWSPRYHDGQDPRLFTLTKKPIATSEELGDAADHPTAFCPEGLEIVQPTPASNPAATDELGLDDLLKFWAHPCRSFLQNSLRVRIHSDEEQADNDEPFDVDGLTRYQLHDNAVRLAQRDNPGTRDPRTWTMAQGVLPIGGHGEACYHALRNEVEPMLAEARHYASSITRDIDLQLNDVRVTGTIDGFTDDHRHCMRASKLKPKDRLRAWIQHLCMTIQQFQEGEDAETPWPKTTRVVAMDGIWIYEELEEIDARAHLTQLIKLFREGHARPLPFFESSSFSTGRLTASGKDPEKALLEGVRSYHPSGSHGSYSNDASDVAIQLCMRDRDPFEKGTDSEFFQLAKTIWQAPINCLKEQK